MRALEPTEQARVEQGQGGGEGLRLPGLGKDRAVVIAGQQG